MAAAAAEAVVVYRSLLKAIQRNLTTITGNRTWLEFAKEEFRQHRAAASADQAQDLLQLAKDYTMMIDGVREHRELLLSYNIGIPIEEREETMTKRAAALVGFSLPPPPPPYEKV